jgi:hypothetical protein
MRDQWIETANHLPALEDGVLAQAKARLKVLD